MTDKPPIILIILGVVALISAIGMGSCSGGITTTYRQEQEFNLNAGVFLVSIILGGIVLIFWGVK